MEYGTRSLVPAIREEFVRHTGALPGGLEAHYGGGTMDFLWVCLDARGV